MAQLARLVDLLDARRNQIFAPVALPLLWGTQIALAIEAWRRRIGPAVARWLAVVGEIEALSSLAGYAFENPDDPFPEIVDGRAALRRRGAGAPAAAAPRRACANDVALGGGRRAC